MLGLTHDMCGYIRVKAYLISSLLQLNQSHSIGPRDRHVEVYDSPPFFCFINYNYEPPLHLW